MATPTRSQGVSTPRNLPTSTPSRQVASPRPNTMNLQNRAFSYKSPAVKTPASVPGHSHRFSNSSHPISTPMAAPAIHDELLNLNSPAAALIASIGGQGLTPLPSGQDGLGITTGIPPAHASDPPLPRNPDLERTHRLQEVARLLERESLGRGITRDRLRKLAQREKFDQQWDADTVNIAGVCVDLEIAFDPIRTDVVRDVTLNLVTDETGDPQLQEAASSMLKQELINPELTAGSVTWRSPADFARNLHYLSHHDQIKSSVNCFQLVGDLYNTFQSIWAEEKRRMRERHEALHICQGNVGKPSMDVHDRLGLTTHYWVQRHQYVAATEAGSDSAQDKATSWSGCFSVDSGQPSIGVNRRWLAAEPLVSAVTTEKLFQEGQVERPNWQDESSEEEAGAMKNKPSTDNQADGMEVDEPVGDVPTSLNLQFVCDFAPSVLIPVSVITDLNSQGLLLQIDQNGPSDFYQALLNEQDRKTTVATAMETPRLKKSVDVFSREGHHSVHDHAYMLQQSGAAYCCPVTQLRFSHPRQFAEAVPIFRQYALAWSILRRTVIDDTLAKMPSTRPSEVLSAQDSRGSKIVKRSNKKPAQAQLERLLSGAADSDQTLNIDISLDTVSDTTKVKLNVLIPAPRQSYIGVLIEVQRNGIVDVASLTGPSPLAEDKIKRQASRVIGLSEDIGILAQWLLKQLDMKT